MSSSSHPSEPVTAPPPQTPSMSFELPRCESPEQDRQAWTRGMPLSERKPLTRILAPVLCCECCRDCCDCCTDAWLCLFTCGIY